jgi:LacI family transcriptional regulator
MSAAILYLNTVSGDLIHRMKFAGIRRYAAMRGWEAVAVPRSELPPEGAAALLAAHSPVAGCVIEASADETLLSQSLFGSVPVVYLHPPSSLRDGRAAYVATDNEAVARAAFRELSARRPAAYAVVGYRLLTEWSVVRMRVFADLADKAHVPCNIFDDCGTDAYVRSAERAPAIARWVAALPRHTAIFAVNDGTAAEVVAAAAAAHRSIPRELTLCGVDNLAALCETGHPTITSIQIDFERAGFLAARLLAARMTDRAARGMTGAANAANDGALRANYKITSLPPEAARHCGPDGRDDGGVATVGPLMAVWRESTGGAGRREPHIMAAVERIRREACDGLTAQKVIAESPGSKRLFNLRFREATGHSVLEEIRHVRLEKVETLLSQTDTPIGAIADFCGWGSSTALERFFRSRTGMTMREWRGKNRG